MGLSVTPSALTSCGALLVKASPPTSAQTLEWSCSPESASICAAFAAAVSGTFQEEVILNESVVSAAGVANSSSVAVTLRVDAWDGDQLLSYADGTFSFVPSVSQLLDASPGSANTFTLLDTSVRLAVSLDSCESVTTSLLVVEWSYANSTAGPWTSITSTSSSWSQLIAPISDFPGLGSYFVRAVMPLLSSEPEVTFSITLEDSPGPVIEFLAPENAGTGCDIALDASGSYDPASDDALAFSWNCTASGATAQDASDCSALAAAAAASSLTVVGGTLGEGSYTFTVTATAATSSLSTSESATVVVGVSSTPVVSMAEPASQVSPQQDLSLSAVVTASSSCQAPLWKAWWLVEETSGNATFLYQVESPVSLSYSAPLPVATGSYSLRLVLSDAPNAGSEGDDDLGVYAFDTSYFEVDAVPLYGTARIYPTVGDAATTTFILSSLDWVDDDIPLQHRFSASMSTTLTSASSTTELEQASWSVLSAFSVDENLESVVFSEVGDFAVRAEAMDTIGSVSAAYTFGELQAVAATIPELLEVLQEVTTSGSTFSIIAAVTALALVDDGDNVSFTSTLISTLQDNTADEASAEAFTATVDALTAVLDSPTDVDVDVAAQAADLMASVANTATDSGVGLDSSTATSMVENEVTLLASLQSTFVDSGNSSSVLALASAIESSLEAIAEAVAVTISEGDTLVISTSGINMTVVSDNADQVVVQGTSVGGFNVPPLDFLSDDDGRRLTSACDSSTVTFQHVVWAISPHVVAGNSSAGGDQLTSVVTAVTGSSSTDGVSCCDVDTTTVQTFNLRICGQTVHIQNLTTPLTFEIALPEKVDQNLRLCQYFDTVSETWSSEGCSVVGTYSDRIVCSCTHASSFVGALGNAPIEAVSDFIDGTNTDLLSAAGFTSLGIGDWYQQPAAIALWVLLLIHIAIAYVAWWRSHHMGMEFGWGDALLWWNQPEQLEELKGSPRNQKTGLARLRPGGDRPVLRAAAWLLGVKVNIDEVLGDGTPQRPGRPLLEGLVDLAGLKCLQMTVARGLGLFDSDLYLLSEERVRRARATRALDVVDEKGKAIKDSRNSRPMAKLSQQAIKVLTREEVFDHPVDYRHRLWQWLDFLIMIHPINLLLHYSLELAWTYRFSALANAVFGSLALSALFFIRDACLNTVYCATGSVWDTFGYDVFIALLTNTLAAFPAWAILRQGRKTLSKRIKSKPQEDEQVKKWNQQDLGTLGLSGVYLLACFLFILVFIANVSDLDKNRWLLRTVVRSVLAWVVLPMVLALMWTGVAYYMYRSPDYAKRLQELLRKQLEPPKQFTEIEKKFWDWASKFSNPLRLNEESGRPAWVPAPPAPPLDFRSGRAPAPPPMPPPGPAPGVAAAGGWGPPPPPGPGFAPPAPPTVYSDTGPAFENLQRLGTPDLPQFWEWVTQLRSAAVAEAPPDNNIVGLPMEDQMRRPFRDTFREGFVTPESPGFFGHPGFAADAQDQFWDWAGDATGYEEAEPSIPQPSPGFMAEDEFWTWATGLARVQSLEALEADEETDNQFWDWVSEFPHLQRLQSVEALDDTARVLANSPMPPAPLDLALVDLPPPPQAPLQYINPTASGRDTPGWPPRSTPLVPPLPPAFTPEQLSPTGAWPPVAPPPGPPPQAPPPPRAWTPPSLDQARPVESTANPQFDHWVEQLMASRLPEAPLLAPLAPPRTPGFVDQDGFGLNLDVGGAGPSGETPMVTPFDMHISPFNQGVTPAIMGPTPVGSNATPYQNDATPYVSGPTPAATSYVGGATPAATANVSGPAPARPGTAPTQPADAGTGDATPRTGASARGGDEPLWLSQGPLSSSLSLQPTQWPVDGQPGAPGSPAGLPGEVRSPGADGPGADASSAASPQPPAPGQQPSGAPPPPPIPRRPSDGQNQTAPTRRI